MAQRISFLLAGKLLALVVLAMTVFTVEQRRSPFLFQLVEIRSGITEPGLPCQRPIVPP